MKFNSFLTLASMLFFLASCCNKGGQNKTNNTNDISSSMNPFYEESKLPFQTADFDKIKTGHFKPALERGIKEQLADIEKIANNTEPATFDNTLAAIEKSGILLRRVSGVFGLMSSANTNPELQKLQEDIAPKLAAASDAIYLNSNLYKKVETIYNNRAKLKLDAESERLVEFYYQKFELAGAKLKDADKTALKKLNKEEATLSAKFTNMLMAAAKSGSITVDDKSKLDGLEPGAIEAAAQDAQAANLKGKWMLKLQNTTQQPALASLKNREVRRQLFEASWNRTEKRDANDTREIVARIAEIRARKAKLIGFPNFSSLQLKDQMAKTPEAVLQFLGKLVPAATAKAKKEASDIQALMSKQGADLKLQPWDWEFYAEQVRKAKYDLDENEIKPYFEVFNVLQNGIFYAANQLYGITFKERKDLPVYNKDVRVFEVFDKDNSSLALFYCDFFKRDNKNGGAWMDNIVTQSKLLGTKPVIYNICNFTKPATGQPALISFSDVTTMFHEFGHGLHGIFANQKYPSISGSATARDFVEFPSQFNEHWATEAKVFKHYALHYKTGEPMPQKLVDKMKKSTTFNQGYALTELLAAANLDIQWHMLKDTDPLQDVDNFEIEALHKTNLDLPQVPTRYRSSYFLHIWSNGYASGYYAYLWAEMLDDDAYAWFEEHGGLTRANGQRFRDMVLSRGNSMDLGKMYHDFRGGEPSIKPMMQNRGLVEEPVVRKRHIEDYDSE